MKTAFLFPGQGSQYIGMCKELYENFETVRCIVNEASDILNLDLKRIIFNGEQKDFEIPGIVQILIYITSISSLNVVTQMGIKPDAVAGHSFGEYSALTYLGAFDWKLGLDIIAHRGKYMDEAAKKNDGAMCAVMSGNIEIIEDIKSHVDSDGGYAIPVNYNTPKQTVFAGYRKDINKIISICDSKKIRAVPLNVAGAFHCKLMEYAAQKFEQYLENVHFNSISNDTKFYSNITGTQVTDNIDLKTYLSQHLMSPVLFSNEINAMNADGIDTFIELGPKKTLSSFVKQTLKNVNIYNVEDMSSLNKLKSNL